MSTPEVRLFALTMLDGSVSVMHYIVEGAGTPRSDPTDHNIQWEIAKWGPERAAQVVSFREIQRGDLPAHRIYRNAWTDTGKAIEHDIVKARELHREIMRRARTEPMKALDTAYQRADEVKDTKARDEISVKKQVLRDITAMPEIEAAATVEELKAVWPEELELMDLHV